MTNLQLLKHIAAHLTSSQKMIAVAESCTGGLFAAELTRLPGSSVWFDRGFVTYSNAAKKELLGVPEETLALYGAVSEETAKAMAKGAITHSQAQVSLAITGIAGPDGGTIEKPVGTVWFAIAANDRAAVAILQIFDGTREVIRRKAVDFALNCLSTYFLKEKE